MSCWVQMRPERACSKNCNVEALRPAPPSRRRPSPKVREASQAPSAQTLSPFFVSSCCFSSSRQAGRRFIQRGAQEIQQGQRFPPFAASLRPPLQRWEDYCLKPVAPVRGGIYLPPPPPLLLLAAAALPRLFLLSRKAARTHAQRCREDCAGLSQQGDRGGGRLASPRLSQKTFRSLDAGVAFRSAAQVSDGGRVPSRYGALSQRLKKLPGSRFS